MGICSFSGSYDGRLVELRNKIDLISDELDLARSRIQLQACGIRKLKLKVKQAMQACNQENALLDSTDSAFLERKSRDIQSKSILSKSEIMKGLKREIPTFSSSLKREKTLLVENRESVTIASENSREEYESHEKLLKKGKANRIKLEEEIEKLKTCILAGQQRETKLTAMALQTEQLIIGYQAEKLLIE